MRNAARISAHFCLGSRDTQLKCLYSVFLAIEVALELRKLHIPVSGRFLTGTFVSNGCLNLHILGSFGARNDDLAHRDGFEPSVRRIYRPLLYH